MSGVKLDAIEILRTLRSLFNDFGYPFITNVQKIGSLYKVSLYLEKLREAILSRYGIYYDNNTLLEMSIQDLASDILSCFGKESTYQSSSSGPSSKRNSRRLNLVVVGRAGVGKSSFLNYAAGKNVFKTGVGDPVTQSYFDVIEINKPEKNVTYSLFDTKGLEAGNTEEWKNAIFSEIEKRDQSDNIYDWFHTIIFCIDASSKRIQPFEVKAIQELQKSNSVLVLLTKKDLVSPDILEGLKSQLKREIGDKVQVLSVCNVSTRTRKGESNASGLEDVLRISFLGLWEKAAVLLPYRAIKSIVEINARLTVDCDLPDLCAVATLLLAYNEPNETQTKEFCSLCDISDSEREYTELLDHKDNIPTKYFEKISELADVNIQAYNKKASIFLKGWFFNVLLETPDELDHDLLDAGYYTTSIRTYLRLVKECFSTLLEGIKIGLKTIRNKIGSNDVIISEILRFYNDINGSHHKPIFNHKTAEVVSILENTDYAKLEDLVLRKITRVRKALNEVDNCVFFSGDERRKAEATYRDFHEDFDSIIKELESVLRKFLSCYEAELHSYGQYCIREDEFVKRNERNTRSEEDKTSFTLLKKMIKAALTDGKISYTERQMLKSFAEQYGLSEKELDRIITEVRDNRYH